MKGFKWGLTQVRTHWNLCWTPSNGINVLGTQNTLILSAQKPKDSLFLGHPVLMIHNYVSREISPYPYSGVKIMFDPTVEITESTKLYTLLSVLSNIGGFMGLFLGYSMLDSYHVVTTLLQCWSQLEQRYLKYPK